MTGVRRRRGRRQQFYETNVDTEDRNRKLEIQYGNSQPDSDVVASGLASTILQLSLPVLFLGETR